MSNTATGDPVSRVSSRRRLKVGILAFASASVLLLSGLQTCALIGQHGDALTTGEEIARADVRAAVAELRGSLTAMDAALAQIAAHASRLGGPDGPSDAWWTFLDATQMGTTDILDLLVIDNRGIVRHSTDRRLVGTAYKDRFLFETLRASREATVAIDTPRINSKGDVTHGIGRRLSQGFDEFSGVAVATFSPQVLFRISEHAYKQERSFRILHPAGIVMLHEPSERGLVGTSADAYPAMAEFRAGRMDGTLRVSAGRDAGRINSFIVMTHPTLIVATSLGKHTVLAEWRRHALIDSIFVAGFIAALVAAAFLIIRRLDAQEIVEQALARQGHELELAQSVAGVGSFTLDVRTGAMLLSREMARIVGWGADGEAPFRRLLDTIEPAERHRVDNAVKACANTGSLLELDVRMTLATGGERVLRFRGLGDRAGTAVIAVQDVTDVLESEARARETQKIEAMGQLTGGVAHDFNNLLTVILGNSEQLAEDLKDRPDLRQMAEMTMKAAERGAELTRRLLAFARRQTLAPKDTDVNALIADMHGLMRRTLGEHIEIEIMASPDLWRTLVDASQLEIALLNLAINARDAMPEGGKLTIRTSNAHLDHDYAAAHADVRANDYVAISVVDTGCGMNPEVRKRAFEPFFTTKEVGKGSGLGLSMVFGFVKQSGGHVSIYSEPDHGTEVRLYLPRGGDATSDASTRAATPTVGGIETVLMVEDEPMVRDSTRAMLQAFGYRVLIAENGPRGLVALASTPGSIELLLTDMVMPGGMTGRALADEAARMRPGIRVLFMSGYSEETIGDFPGMSGVPFLQKPFRRDALAAMVRKTLAGAAYVPRAKN